MPKPVRITIRVLLALFPLVAGGGYFYLVHPKHDRVERMREELATLSKKGPKLDGPTPPEQRPALQAAIREFSRRALAEGERSAPAGLERIAENHGVQLNEVDVSFDQTKERPLGQFVEVELSAEAPFGKVLSFFAELEGSKRHVVAIQQISIQVPETGMVTLEATLLMLERTRFREKLSTAEATSGARSAG